MVPDGSGTDSGPYIYRVELEVLIKQDWDISPEIDTLSDKSFNYAVVLWNFVISTNSLRFNMFTHYNHVYVLVGSNINDVYDDSHNVAKKRRIYV